MKLLFGQGVPATLNAKLPDNDVSTAYELGWSTLKNGELLAAAEQADFEVFVATDKNLRYQQNLSSIDISIVILSTTAWPTICSQVDRVHSASKLSGPANCFKFALIPTPTSK